LPRSVFAARDTRSADPTGAQSRHLNEIFEGRQSPDDHPMLYVCENFACGAPAVGLAQVESRLEQLSQRKGD
jgi:hypothetical protein